MLSRYIRYIRYIRYMRLQEPVLLSRDNMLLRGCQLRNCNFILGLVVSTGRESKINFGSAALVQKTGRTVRNVRTNCVTARVTLVQKALAVPPPGPSRDRSETYRLRRLRHVHSRHATAPRRTAFDGYVTFIAVTRPLRGVPPSTVTSRS